MSNVNSSDSDATISYGSESDFDGFTLGETEQTSGAVRPSARQRLRQAALDRVDDDV